MEIVTEIRNQPQHHPNPATFSSPHPHTSSPTIDFPHPTLNSTQIFNKPQYVELSLPLQYGEQISINEFLDWLKSIDNYFDYTEIPMKMVVYKLKGGANAWWDQI